MENIQDLLNSSETNRLISVAQAFIFIFVGFLVARLLSALSAKLTQKRFTAHGLLILKRAVFYSVFGLFIISALKQLGFDLSILLGAAGILTVAIGFASQTSASNLISGLFLMFERPFSINDIIRVGQITGEVISIDLLSVKLRTFDNLFVRIPNETMIKSEVTTLTRFPIRRADLLIGIAYKEDIERVKKLLETIADKNPLCLDEPPPIFILNGFGASSIDIQFSVWAKRENFLQLKNSIYTEIKIAFDEHGIEIPFPHMSLYTGSESAPLPIKVVSDEKS